MQKHFEKSDYIIKDYLKLSVKLYLEENPSFSWKFDFDLDFKET